jgi:hypothetical protein
VQQTWGSFAHSSYHALQVKFRKRYAGGLQFLAAYTWSKLIDDYSSASCGCLGFFDRSRFHRQQQPAAGPLAVGPGCGAPLSRELSVRAAFRKGMPYLNRGGLLQAIAGG